MAKDTFTLGGKEFSSRFILGSGKYSMELIKAAVENAGAQIITLAVRRTNTKKKENILDFIPDGVTCQTAHCGRHKPCFDFGGNTSPIVPYRHLPQTLSGFTADCRSPV